MRPASPRTALALLIASVAAVKIFLQVTVPGFLQGDDVETLEAGFRAAFGIEYADWEIRSHLLPEILIAPLLRAASLLLGIDTDGLLLAASIPFVAAGAIATLLVFHLARAWGLAESDAVIAAVLYAVHAIAVVYGVGGFPRPLVAPLIVGAALLATRGTARAAILAGVLIGLAGAARYSEWMFLLPLLVMVGPGVVRASRPPLGGGDQPEPEAGETPAPHGAGRAALVLLGFAAGVCVVGLYDIVSGDGAFSSLIEFARYTLAGGSSSMQAAQPPWWYLARLHQWLPLTALPLLVWGWRTGRRTAFLWIVIPLMVLTLVHHKELRYLQNVVPFLAIAIAAGMFRHSPLAPLPGCAPLDPGSESGGRASRDAPATLSHASGVLPFVLLALTVLWSAWGVNRLDKRSSSAVAAARAIIAVSDAAVAVEQPWAYGGHLYFGNRPVIELPIEPSRGDVARARDAEFVSIFASHTSHERRAWLGELGFAPWRELAAGGRPVIVFRRALPPG